GSAREWVGGVDEGVQGLPRANGLPVILCCLEGRTQDEAARQLGWTPGSLRGRLERGRARLHARLIRRGLTLSAGLVAAEASRGAGSTALVAQWITPTARAALGFVSGPVARGNGPAAAPAHEVLRRAALAPV